MNLDNFKFPLDNYEKLIKDISGLKLDEWINFWEKERDILEYVSESRGLGDVYKRQYLKET